MSIPIPQFSMHVPSLLRSTRLHNAIMKDVVRDELYNHWKHRLPLHFRLDARQRYGHMPRSPRYNSYKNRRFSSKRDLVKTGETERLMRSPPRITVGGAAEGGKNGLRGRLHLTFSWAAAVAQRMRKKFSRGSRRAAAASIKTRTGVNLAQMRKEIQTFTDGELKDIAASIQANYVHRVNTDTSPRQRIKV